MLKRVDVLFVGSGGKASARTWGAGDLVSTIEVRMEFAENGRGKVVIYRLRGERCEDRVKKEVYN